MRRICFFGVWRFFVSLALTQNDNVEKIRVHRHASAVKVLLMKYDTFLFDFDGTIVSSIDAIVLCMTKTFHHFDLTPPSEETIKHYIGIPLEGIPYLDVEGGKLSRAELIEKYRSEVELPEARKLITAYDGIREILDELKGRGAKRGIVSSKITAPILQNLEDNNMSDLFDVVIGSDQVTYYKPAPETVFLCAAQIGLQDARRALVIGDALHDIEMGQNAGMDTCAVPWGAGTRGELEATNPTYFVKDMAELKNILTQTD